MLSLTGIVVVLVVVVGKQQLLPTVFKVERRDTESGGKSENIRLNQMQIERFAVGNFQFSSPCQRESSSSDQASVLSLDSDTGKTNLELIFCRRVSFRLDSIRFARSAGSDKSGWLLPVSFFLSSAFLFGGIHTFGCSFDRVDRLLIIFCSDALVC